MIPNNEKDIFALFNNKKDEELLKEYSLKDLEAMFFALLECEPLSAERTKTKIIKSIRYYIHRIERVEAFNLRAQ